MPCCFPFSRWFASGSYQVPRDTDVRVAPRGRHPQVDDPQGVRSTLQAVLDQLPPTGTRRGNELRRDVERLLSPSGAPRLPELARAREWLDQARYDSDTNNAALGLLPTAVAELKRKWKQMDLPPHISLRSELDALEALVEETVCRPRSPSKFGDMARLDARLQDFRKRMQALQEWRLAREDARTRHHRRQTAFDPQGNPDIKHTMMGRVLHLHATAHRWPGADPAVRDWTTALLRQANRLLGDPTAVAADLMSLARDIARLPDRLHHVDGHLTAFQSDQREIHWMKGALDSVAGHRYISPAELDEAHKVVDGAQLRLDAALEAIDKGRLDLLGSHAGTIRSRLTQARRFLEDCQVIDIGSGPATTPHPTGDWTSMRASMPAA